MVVEPSYYYLLESDILVVVVAVAVVVAAAAVVVVVAVAVDLYYLMYIVVVLADFAQAFSLQPQLYFLQNEHFRCRPSLAYGFGLQKQNYVFKKSSSH